MSPAGPHVRRATPRDATRLATVLASAFLDDPVFAWMLPDPGSRKRRAARVFATMLRSGAIRRGGVDVACRGPALVGGAIWYGPGHWQPGIGEQLRSLPGYARGFGRRLGAASAVAQSMARSHPREPHWYLYVVGVEPAAQGQGVGGALLQARLGAADEGDLGAYLEATRPELVGLYQRFGFATTGTIPLPDGAPVVTAMWRPPRGRA